MSKCIDAFKNLNIVRHHNSLQISPCCLSPTQAVSIIDFKQDPYLKQIRNDWDNNQYPTACQACQQSEARGQTSRRSGSNQWYQAHDLVNDQVELIRMDYWTGDQCNLACVICGPDWSSSWKQELNFEKQNQRAVINQTWSELDLTQLRFVHFNGGEPLLSKEHVKFLQAIPNKSQVQITYNTNGTVLPGAELLSLWQEFQLVQLDFSIDDLESRFEYQRYPAQWNQVVKNLQWFWDHAPHNCIFNTNTAVGVLNHDNLQNLMDWLNVHFNSNRFGDVVEHRQQPVYGLFALENYQERIQEILDFLNACDLRRGTTWKTVFPKLSDYLSTDK
jgi:sulfatase maturation enzyme AslB (radical SAM superfamily)